MNTKNKRQLLIMFVSCYLYCYCTENASSVVLTGKGICNNYAIIPSTYHYTLRYYTVITQLPFISLSTVYQKTQSLENACRYQAQVLLNLLSYAFFLELSRVLNCIKS